MVLVVSDDSLEGGPEEGLPVNIFRKELADFPPIFGTGLEVVQFRHMRVHNLLIICY